MSLQGLSCLELEIILITEKHILECLTIGPYTGNPIRHQVQMGTDNCGHIKAAASHNCQHSEICFVLLLFF